MLLRILGNKNTNRAPATSTKQEDDLMTLVANGRLKTPKKITSSDNISDDQGVIVQKVRNEESPKAHQIDGISAARKFSLSQLSSISDEELDRSSENDKPANEIKIKVSRDMLKLSSFFTNPGTPNSVAQLMVTPSNESTKSIK